MALKELQFAPVSQEVQQALRLWSRLPDDRKFQFFKDLARPVRSELFVSLSSREQRLLLESMPAIRRSKWLRLLEPDDAADLVQAYPTSERGTILNLLEEDTRAEVQSLLAFTRDQAGGLMNPRFVRLKSANTVVVCNKSPFQICA